MRVAEFEAQEKTQFHKEMKHFVVKSGFWNGLKRPLKSLRLYFPYGWAKPFSFPRKSHSFIKSLENQPKSYITILSNLLKERGGWGCA
jgi:hypothetical protein